MEVRLVGMGVLAGELRRPKPRAKTAKKWSLLQVGVRDRWRPRYAQPLGHCNRAQGGPEQRDVMLGAGPWLFPVLVLPINRSGT